jgi:eukaryotic-like serine/threonine-protein kinase
MATSSAVRAPLHDALDSEIRRLDLLLVKAWRLLAAFGVVVGLLVGVALDLRHGPASALVCALGFVWFTAQARWIAKTKSTTPIWIGTVIEATLPSIFLVVIAETQGAAYALGSYVPPMVFTALVLAGAARLRPLPTLVIGVFQGLGFVVLYHVKLRAMLPPDEAGKALFSPEMQWSRGASFAVGGGVTFVVTQALKRAIGRAERSVRALDLFGKYRLEERIGAGGMGVVHRATYCPEGGFERVVAIKLLHAHLLSEVRFIDAFREEAELSARLVHANVVQVFDFGRVRDAYFLAMEHVDGITLAEFLRRMVSLGRNLSEASAVWITREVLLGLAHAHHVARDPKGELLRVVHRDLCPSNVLLSFSGDVKISDFGVAKALRDAAFSQTATILGHVGYMAPEQARGEPIDERSDLFAVGVVVWELLAMQSLFRSSADASALLSIMRGDVRRIRLVRPAVSPDWEPFFDRALAAEPAHRFATADAMREALERIAPEGAQRPPELLPLLELIRETRSIDQAAPPANTRSTVVDTRDRPSSSALARAGD